MPTLPVFKSPSSAAKAVPKRATIEATAKADLGQMRIGDLAKVTGKTARALRLYEELGLLSPGTRSTKGYRLYGADAIDRVEWIGKLQDLGLSLPDIQSAVANTAAADVPREDMTQVRQLLEDKLVEIAAQMDRLHQIRREAAAAMTYLEVCGECEAEAAGPSTCVSCDEHDEQAPAIIIGLTSTADEAQRKQPAASPRSPPSTRRA